MNIYDHCFTATCPNNGETIAYHLRIAARHVIMAEAITESCIEARGCEKPYHETIADFLHQRLGGRQWLFAFHHGVWIETRRG